MRRPKACCSPLPPHPRGNFDEEAWAGAAKSSYGGAAMQAFRNDVFSAPTNFLVLASFRHAVRLACLAAASPDGAAGAPAAVVEAVDELAAGAAATGALAPRGGGAAANAPATAHRLRHAAAAAVEKRTLMPPRIAPTDTAPMKRG
jgi:hypothetical protein